MELERMDFSEVVSSTTGYMGILIVAWRKFGRKRLGCGSSMTNSAKLKSTLD